VPLLVISQDGQPERRIPLTDTPVRIGRDPLNDIVLEDSQSGVSRFHAQILTEGHGYVIADVGSRNGMWVGDRRVDKAPMTPGAVVRIGRFTLSLLDQESTPASDPATQVTQGEEYTVCFPLPVVGSPIPPVQASGPPAAPLPTPAAPAPIQRQINRRAWLLTGTAVLVGLILILQMLRGTAPSPPRESNPPTPVTRIEIPEGTTAANAPGASDQPPPASPDIPATNVPGRADSRTGSAAAAQERQRAAADVDVPRLAGEDAASWQARAGRVRAAYAAAQALVTTNPARALNYLEEVERNQPNYRDTSSLKESARQRLGQQAQQALATAAAAEQAGNLRSALASYKQAHELDPATDVSDATARVRGQMVKLGTAAYQKARKLHAEGITGEALASYKEAMDLLPDDEPVRQNVMRDMQTLQERQWPPR
jgi:pSer/pThr/pTyr-binding forkhead associated (FHA) protein